MSQVSHLLLRKFDELIQLNVTVNHVIHNIFVDILAKCFVSASHVSLAVGSALITLAARRVLFALFSRYFLPTYLSCSQSNSYMCIGTRGYAQAVLRKKSIFDNPHHTPSNHSSSSRKDSPWGNREKFGQDAQPTPLWQLKPDPQFSEHLNAVFNPLEFNPEAARRCLTHASHPTAVNGHNQGMSFLGMSFYSVDLQPF